MTKNWLERGKDVMNAFGLFCAGLALSFFPKVFIIGILASVSFFLFLIGNVHLFIRDWKEDHDEFWGTGKLGKFMKKLNLIRIKSKNIDK